MPRGAQPRPDRRDQGFTLIELLVVVIIVGDIGRHRRPDLSSTSARRAWTPPFKADIKAAAIEVETYMVDHPENQGDWMVDAFQLQLQHRHLSGPDRHLWNDGHTFKVSPGNFIEVFGYSYAATGATEMGYCISGANRGSTKGWANMGARPNDQERWFYDSVKGGITSTPSPHCGTP